MRLLYRAQLDVAVDVTSPDEAYDKIKRIVQRHESLTGAAALRERLYTLIGAYDVTPIRPDERELAQPILDTFEGVRLFSSTYLGYHCGVLGHVRRQGDRRAVRPIALMLTEPHFERLGTLYEDREESPEPGGEKPLMVENESGIEPEATETQTRLWENFDE